ncbi:MAG: thioredoxin fold domain-containing protein [Muribaculaceae bacterium]|nr:thioredoxin fold domain-containing protein [Muribaculaceae bacterium]
MKPFFTLLLSSVLALSACGASPAADKSDKKSAEIVEYKGNSEITPNEKLPTIIDFNADWCGPCQRFKPVFHNAAENNKDKALFVSVNVDKNPKTAEKFGVRGIPQITILYPDGTVKTQVGAMDDTEFKALLREWL